MLISSCVGIHSRFIHSEFAIKYLNVGYGQNKMKHTINLNVVRTDVPPNSVVFSNPARVIYTVDELVKKRKQLAVERPEYFPDKSI